MSESTAETISTSAGRKLAGRAFPGAESRSCSILILGALAAPHAYLGGFARWLSAQGYGVLSFDYRGVGASQAAGDPCTNLDDWGEDALAAARHARERFECQRLLVLGHSIGGMLFGHAGVAAEAQGALLIASGLGRPSFYRGRGRLRVEAAYRALPRVARLCGELPRSRFFLQHRVPRDVIVHWSRWGRVGDFHRWNGESTRERFACFQGPLCGVRIEGDVYTPTPAVQALLDHFVGAGVRRETLRAAPGERLGHFGLFRGREETPGRRRLLTWLREVQEAAERGPVASAGRSG